MLAAYLGDEYNITFSSFVGRLKWIFGEVSHFYEGESVAYLQTLRQSHHF